MNIFTRKQNTVNIADAEVKEELVPVEDIQEAVQDEVEEFAETTHSYKIKYNGKKYKVSASSREEAEQKILNFFSVENVDEKIDKNTEENVLRVKDIFNAALAEITRIVTVAHPETVNNTYDRWISVIGEEFGEIVHELNDEYEGKRPTKNTFVECIQLIAATTLLAKKFANEHPSIFEEE